MKSDLDRLMKERNLDAFMVLGDSGNNPAMNYLTGGIHLEHAIVLKRRGGPMTLVHGSLERTGAATTGLELVDRDRVYNQYDLLNKHQGDRLSAMLDYYSQVIRDQQLTGRLGVYGKIDAGGAYQLLNRLQAVLPDVEIVGEYADSIFAVARETKDDAEIAELLTAGRETCAVVGEVQEFIQGHGVRGKTVVRTDGEPLTIGDVKAFIRMRLMAHGGRGSVHSSARAATAPCRTPAATWRSRWNWAGPSCWTSSAHGEGISPIWRAPGRSAMPPTTCRRSMTR